MSSPRLFAGEQTGLHLIWDARCLLNFHFAQALDPILRASGCSNWIAEDARLQGESVLTAAGSQVLVPLLDAGLLRLADFETDDEAALHLGLLQRELEEAEAAGLSLSIKRGWGLATDDASTLRLARAMAPGLKALTTPNILKEWADSQDVPRAVVAAMVDAIRSQGRYDPPSEHPLRPWWDELAAP